MDREDRLFPISSAALFWVLAVSQFFPQANQFSEALLEGHFRDVQGGVFGLFFSVPRELGPENGHSLFTDVCM